MFGTGLWVNAGSFLGYLVVWIMKFFVLERIFGHHHRAADAVEPEPARVR